MNKVGLLVMLQALPGKEAEVEQFLRFAGPLVDAETGTTSWFAFRVAPATFGIFDTFADEERKKCARQRRNSKGPFRLCGRPLCPYIPMLSWSTSSQKSFS